MDKQTKLIFNCLRFILTQCECICDDTGEACDACMLRKQVGKEIEKAEAIRKPVHLKSQSIAMENKEPVYCRCCGTRLFAFEYDDGDNICMICLICEVIEEKNDG